MRAFVLAVLVAVVSASSASAQDCDILYREYESISNQIPFKAGSDWLPYPHYADRDAWNSILGDSSAEIIRRGEKCLGYKWGVVTATSYLEYERSGDRTVMETPLKGNRGAINALMLAELAEGKGRFIDELVNGLWQMACLPSWVLSAHQPRQASKRSLPDPRFNLIDLSSCATGASLALALHFFRDKFDSIDPSISYVIETSVREKIIDCFMDETKDKANWWLGFQDGALVNNWNPWCNSDVLLCLLLLEKDQKRLEKAVERSIRSVDRFINYVKADGACEEGPAYWPHAAGKLYEYLQILHDASAGQFTVFDNPRIRSMGEYVSRSYVADGWVVNFADATAKLSFPVSMVYNYGKAVGSREMQDFALYLLGDDSLNCFKQPSPAFGNDTYRSLESLRTIREISEEVEGLNINCHDAVSYENCRLMLRKTVPPFVWYPQTQFCYMRNSNGWFLAAKGGHNNESHNHNDVGTFTLYIDGTPVLVDAGVGTYTKQTFSADRYSIWSMGSDWHNLPGINGTSEIFGREFCAKDVSASYGRGRGVFSADISGAYGECASCNRWNRTLTLTDKGLVLKDDFSLRERILPDTERLLVQGQVFLSGQTWNGHAVGKSEVIVVNGDVAVRISYPEQLKASVDVCQLTDPRMTKVWGDTLRRISLTTGDDAPLRGSFKIEIVRIQFPSDSKQLPGK